MSGGGKGGKVTVGYKYSLGIQMGLCHGPIDGVSRIEVDRRVAWEGFTDGTDPIVIDAPELFGGQSREGGVSGAVDIDMGAPTQLPNSYLVSVLGEDVPAYRGVVCAVLKQVYTGNNPYLKPWSFRAHRAQVAQDGSEQWYVSTSLVPKVDAPNYCASYLCDALEIWILSRNGLWNAGFFHYDKLNGESLAYDETGNGRTWGFVSSVGTTVDPQDPGVNAPGNCDSLDCPRVKAGIYHPSEIVPAGDVSFGGTFLGVGGVLRRYGTGGSPASNGIPIASVHPHRNASSGTTLWWDYTKDEIRLTYRDAAGAVVSVNLTESQDMAAPPNNTWFYVEMFLHIVNVASGQSVIGVTLAWVDSDGTGQIYGASVNPLISMALWYPATNGGMVALTNQNDVAYNPDYDYLYGWTFTGSRNGELRDEEFWSDILEAYGETRLVEVMRKLAEDGQTLSSLYPDGTGQGNFGARMFLQASPALEQFSITECGCSDMNPSHIIRECLTNDDWGLGYSDSDIDDTSFQSAANQLLGEYMGISLQWERQIPIEDFISEILRHIDGVLYVSRSDGKFVLTLIRDDYALSDLTVLDESNVLSISDSRTPTSGELTTSVTVNFWDCDTGNDASVTEHNYPLMIQQGAEVMTTVQYPGFTSRELASRAAIRDLTALSTPLRSCTVSANREASALNVGDAFILDWPDLQLNSVVMRVQKLSLGDGNRNEIAVNCIEDVFSLPDREVTQNTDADTLWTDPSEGAPLAASPQLAEELPYYELVTQEGQVQADAILADDNDAGFLLFASGRQSNEINGDLYTDSGGGFSDEAVLDFCPHATVNGAVWYSDTEISIRDGKDLGEAEAGSIAQIGNELVRVDSVSSSSLTVGRGILDTVPVQHVDGETVYFWGFSYSGDKITYTAGESVSGKVRTRLGQNVLSLDAAPEAAVTLNSRAIRPYPPGDLRIDGESYPEDFTSSTVYYAGAHTISWARRDRLQQTDANLYDHTEGDIGPEAGTTYKVEAYSQRGNGEFTDIWLSEDVGGANSYDKGDSNFPSSFDSNDYVNDSNFGGEPPRDSVYVFFRVTAFRDGYASWQSAELRIPHEDLTSFGPDSNDPQFANVISLFNFAEFGNVDFGYDPQALSFNGTATLDSNGAAFDGSASQVRQTEDVPFKQEFNGGASTAWTIEFKFRVGAVDRAQALLDWRGSDSLVGLSVFQRAADPTTIGFRAGDATAGWEVSIDATTSIAVDEDVEVAITRSGSDYYLHVNGIYQGADSSSIQPFVGTSGFLLGRWSNDLDAYLDGHIYRLRFTARVARYSTGNYTPEPGLSYPA